MSGVHVTILCFVVGTRLLLINGFYYGKSTDITVPDAKAQCESLGMRLAMFHTQADWEAAKSFLNAYHTLFGKDKNVWIGIERDVSQPTMVYKWMDGTTLSWGSFYNSPWKDSSTPVNDVTKACVKMEWGAGLLWKHHDCSSTEDFLCEGFYLNPNAIGDWSTGKSTCEGMGMQLASLKSSALNAAAITYITVQQTFGSTGDVWFGLSLSGDYVHEDGTVVTSGSYAYSWYNDPWGSSEPSRGGSELCVRLRNRGFADFDWADYGCGSKFNYLCKDNFAPVTTTTTTTTPVPTTTTTIPETTTKPWWFVEYSEDGKAIGQNGKTFDKSNPPARFGVVGLLIGFSTFGFVTVVICMLWFCCIRSKDDYWNVQEEEEEEPQKKAFSAITDKPHGIQYIA